MLTDARTGAFLAVTDRARAREFYSDVLGLALKHEDDFALVFDSFGTALRVSPVKSFSAQPFTVLGWEVPDIKKAVAALAARGIEFVRVPGLPQDDQGIWSPGPGIFVAWFKDPDGNMLSVAQH
ncbi:MAG TPA: VOC family protein [Rhizomicrobium sp.]|nr:VOC family protein [Rhizomicrobium sp.]